MSGRLRRVGGVGVALILIGIAVPLGFRGWMQSRSWVPLDIPISMAAGHIRSPEFEINLEGEYWIYVDVDRRFNPDSIECLLGLPPYYNDCHDHPSIVQTSWRITKAGNEVARDHNIAPVRVGPWDRVGRAIGSFAADKSKHYALDLDILADASELNGGNPRLKIEELGGAYVRYSSLEDDWSNVAFLLVVTGIVLLVVVLVGWARERDRWRLQLTTVGPQPRELFFDHNDARPAGNSAGSEKKKLPASFWFGVVLVCAGAASFSSIAIWLNTRNWTPVDMPLSLARGHVRTGPFKVNVRAGYDVRMDYSTSSERADCFWYSRGKASWSLYGTGVRVKDFSDPSSYASLGWFDGEHGIYELDLQIDSDTGCLDAGHPRLRISTERYAFEDKLNPWMWLSAFCVPCGLSLVVLGCIARFRKERDVASELTGEASVGQNFFWARRLPLRKPFTGLPPFGLVAALVYIMFWLPTRLIDAMLFDAFHSRGIYVWSAQAVPVARKSVAQPDPVVVRIEAGVFGSAPRLYLNGVSVTWADLQKAIQKRIGRRSDCTVFVSANDDAAWDEAAQVMDAARGLGCKVVLLTTEQEKPPAH
jgi:biopolymer transport protein ExbD